MPVLAHIVSWFLKLSALRSWKASMRERNNTTTIPVFDIYRGSQGYKASFTCSIPSTHKSTSLLLVPDYFTTKVKLQSRCRVSSRCAVAVLIWPFLSLSRIICWSWWYEKRLCTYGATIVFSEVIWLTVLLTSVSTFFFLTRSCCQVWRNLKDLRHPRS